MSSNGLERFQRLLVVLTRTDGDAFVIRYASMIAKLARSEQVHFVYVLPNFRNSGPSPSNGQVTAEVGRQVAVAFSGAPQLGGRGIHILRTAMVPGLLSFSAENEIDLIVVGHVPSNRSSQKALIRRLSMKAPCSVWVVPEGCEPEITRLLAPVDFTAASADALEVAADAAARAGAEDCIALHVYHTEAVITYDQAASALRAKAQEAFDELVKAIDLQGTKIRPVFAESEEVAKTIGQIATVEGASLAVIAAHGSQPASTLLGSITTAVIDAGVPLLIVKRFGSKLSLLETLLDRAFRRSSPHFN